MEEEKKPEIVNIKDTRIYEVEYKTINDTNWVASIQFHKKRLFFIITHFDI